MTDRRTFLKQAGVFAASLPLGAALLPQAVASPPADNPWTGFKQLFNQDPDYLHFSNFLVASHPRPVREAIERYRAQIDRNPGLAMDWDLQETWKREGQVREWAGRYLKATPPQIALTGSTSEGLAMIYGGLQVRADQEILTTVHEHYATQNVLDFRARQQGTQVRRISLFENPSQVSVDEILGNIQRAIRPQTRVLGMTWVQSGSGVKLPIGEIGTLVADVNRHRDERDRILYVVDGVHGLGVENLDFPDMHCDFLIAGTHKWMFGPRGTGLVCARDPENKYVTPMVPTFSEDKDFATIMTLAASTPSNIAGRRTRRSSCTCNWARRRCRRASMRSTANSRSTCRLIRASNWSRRAARSCRRASRFSGSGARTARPWRHT